MSDLARAYAETRYIVEAPQKRFVIRIGAVAPDLPVAGAIITAWNPGSRRMTPAWNARASGELAAWIARQGAPCWPSRTEPDDPAWVEEGWLITDLNEAEAVALAVRFGQNALVWVAPGEAARLVATPLWNAGGQE